LQMKNGRAAAAEFQRILDHRGEVPASSFYPLAYAGLASAAMLSNDAEKARRAYQDFFAVWKDADADLLPLRDAREAFGRLQ